jgi:ELWxxDGT repeat protein
MIFAADDGVDGNELWITDGTPAGTRFFKDLAPGASSSDPSSFVLFNDTVYFVASGGLWKTDGTSEGTVMVKSVDQVTNLLVAGPRMFFSGYTAQAGSGPWVSDGTEAGTHLVALVASATEVASGISIGATCS